MRRGTTVLLLVAALIAPAAATPPVFNGSIAVPSGGNASIATIPTACGLGTDSSGNVKSNVACFNVKMYGAKGDGTTDDTAAINNTVTAAGATCGIVFLPPGTYYLGSGPILPASCVWIAGSGVGATTFKLNGALTGGNADGIRFSIANGGTYLTNVRLSDFTIDATNQTAANGMTLQGFYRMKIEHVSILNPFGFGIVVGSNGGATPSQYSTDLYMNDIRVEGERNGNDSIGGGSMLRGVIQNYTAINAAGTCSDLTNITNFTYHNVWCYRSGTPATAADGFDIDFGGTNVLYDGVFVDGAHNGLVFASTSGQSAQSNIQVKNFTLVDLQKSAIFFNSASGLGPSFVAIGDGYIANWNQANTTTQGVVLQGGSNVIMRGVQFGAPAFAAYAIQLTNDSGGANPTSKARLYDNNVSAAAPNTIQLSAVGSNVQIANTVGYNPIGVQTAPGIPASATPLTNPFQSDMTVHVTGGTVTAIAIGGTSTGLTSGTFRVPVGQTITLTYSVAPTWTWFGD